MSETSSAEPIRRFDLKRLFPFLFHPRREYDRMAGQEKSSWLTPMLILSIALLIRVLVTGFLRARAAAMGEVTLPPGWEWWSPDMQNNYMQAMQATQGPAFLYVIPSITGLAGLWLGWSILSGLFHLISTLLGGRGKMSSALNVVAWASLPFALRDLLRAVFMLIIGHTIASPGLSGFVIASEGGALFFAKLLEQADLFLVWRAVLLVLGFKRLDELSTAKAIAAVLIGLIVALAAQAGLGALSASLGGMMITRPFF